MSINTYHTLALHSASSVNGRWTTWWYVGTRDASLAVNENFCNTQTTQLNNRKTCQFQLILMTMLSLYYHYIIIKAVNFSSRKKNKIVINSRQKMQNFQWIQVAIIAIQRLRLKHARACALYIFCNNNNINNTNTFNTILRSESKKLFLLSVTNNINWTEIKWRVS